MRVIFRYTVVVSTALFIILWFLPYFDHHWLDDTELTMLAASGYGSLIPKGDIIYWSLFGAWLIVSVGLWLFINAARTAFLWLIICSSIAQFFWGFSIFTSYENGIQNLITLSDGAILVMAYFTSASKEFAGDS